VSKRFAAMNVAPPQHSPYGAARSPAPPPSWLARLLRASHRIFGAKTHP